MERNGMEWDGAGWNRGDHGWESWESVHSDFFPTFDYDSEQICKFDSDFCPTFAFRFSLFANSPKEVSKVRILTFVRLLAKVRIQVRNGSEPSESRIQSRSFFQNQEIRFHSLPFPSIPFPFPFPFTFPFHSDHSTSVPFPFHFHSVSIAPAAAALPPTSPLES